jgi:hypothetical protein
MNDTESESDIEETSAGAALSVPVQQVCHFRKVAISNFQF